MIIYLFKQDDYVSTLEVYLWFMIFLTQCVVVMVALLK